MSGVNPTANRLLFVLSILGLFIAGFLWYAHSQNIDIPCGPSHDCDIVAASPYARFPEGTGPYVATYGFFAYLGFAVLAFLRTMNESPSVDRLYLRVIVVGTILGTLCSFRLTYAELFIIHAICKWCVASQIIIFLMAVISLVEWFGKSSPRSLQSNS